MPALTDDQLEALLRRTFAEHEAIADPARAWALAEASPALPGPSRPSRMPLVLLAAGVALLVVLAAAGWGPPRASAPLAPAPSVEQTAQRAERERAKELAESARQRVLARVAQSEGAARRAAAREEVARLLDLAPRPPGAKVVPNRLADDALGTSFADEVYAERWYSVPGTAADALAYLRARPPAGLTAWEDDPQPNDQTIGRTLQLGYGGRPTPELTLPELRTSIIEVATGPVLVRYEAATSVRPARPAWLPDAHEITAVSFRIVRPGADDPTRTRVVEEGSTMDPEAVETMARAFGSLYTIPQYAGHCPYRPGTVDEFTFRTADGDVRVVADLNCPAVVRVSRATGGAAVDLADPQALDAAWQLARLSGTTPRTSSNATATGSADTPSATR